MPPDAAFCSAGVIAAQLFEAANPPSEADPAQAALIGEISARVEAAYQSGRRVNVVELGRRERAILHWDGMLVTVGEGEEITLHLRPVEAAQALSVLYDPAG